MSQINDISLIAQVVTLGNKRAFDKLVQKYQSPIRRFLLNLTLGDTMLSDDLAQETFIKAYLNIRSFQGISAFLYLQIFSVLFYIKSTSFYARY
jgi:RNA polymerase sigma-70 factor (ECF subfamily)